MANKEDLTRDLNELGQKLGRSLNTTGTAADLELRIREAREELDALSDPLPGGDSESGAVMPPALSQNSGAEVSHEHSEPSAVERVCVRVLKTLHLQAWNPVNGSPVRVAEQDSKVMINASELPVLQGLVIEAE